MEDSDEVIIARVLDGQNEAFSVLVKRYQKQIFNLMLRYSRSEIDAADLTQDAFIRAYEKLDRFKPGNSFFSWMYKLALNVAHDWRRKNSRMRNKHKELYNRMPELVKSETGHENILQLQEEIDQLQNAMLELADETREIILLRYHHNRSVQETAEIFSISQSAVKMRTSRGISQLQELMQGKING